MRMPGDAPLTEAIFAVPKGSGPPSAIEREWTRFVRKPGDLVFLWAGATWQGADTRLTWHHFYVHGGEVNAEHPDPVLSTPAEHVERLLAPLAHASRIRIMQVLYDSSLPPGQLSEAVGLRGGSLYHHLRELLYAAYVAEEGGCYALTNLGKQMLITVTVLAGSAVMDRGEQGLGIGVSPPSEQPA